VPWNAHEAITFLRAVRAHRLYAACVLVLVLGLRRSEVLGLRWQDIDFEAGQFTPVKQVQRVKGVGLVLKDLKTESSQAVLRSAPVPWRSAGSSSNSNGRSLVTTGPRTLAMT
jgi:integrase